MSKTLLITGATDGIGRATAEHLAADGHTLVLHGRNADKLSAVAEALRRVPGAGVVRTHRADLTRYADTVQLAKAVAADVGSLDVLINNAGVFTLADPITPEGFDARFIVNTVAPYVLTHRLADALPVGSRVINLSSAAQAPVDLDALLGKRHLAAGDAYAQSKLALTMWSFELANALVRDGPSVIAVNPGSFLASKMVKDAYGLPGHDLAIGAQVLARAALSADFAHAAGRYFDNDRGQFADPHPDALDGGRNAAVIAAIEQVIRTLADH
ncbi:MAG: SDR family NAD(P)-dependent oxidoreductase [Pseudomonadota bacterium]